MIAQHSVQDHIVHFYHLSALDWVDLFRHSRRTRPRRRSWPRPFRWPGNSAAEFKAVQERLQALSTAGKLGIFASGYWGHPAMKLPPEANLMAVAHYLQRLRLPAQGRPGRCNPRRKKPAHSEPGGGRRGDRDQPGKPGRAEHGAPGLAARADGRIPEFVTRCIIPDLLAIAGAYKEWFRYGAGVTNYLAVPEFPEDTADHPFCARRRHDHPRRCADVRMINYQPAR